MTPEELEAILLEDDPNALLQHARRLVAEVRRLQVLLEPLTRLARHLQPRFGDACQLMVALDVSYEVHDDEPTAGDLRRAACEIAKAKG